MKKIAKTLLLSGLCLFMSSCVIVDVGGSYHYDNEANYSVGDATISGEVNTVSTDWISGNVTFMITENAEVSFTESYEGTISEKEKVHYWYDEQHKQLNLKFCAPGKHYDFGRLTKNLIIYIPSAYSSLLVEYNSVSANIVSTVPFVKTFEINTVSGNSDITANDIERVESNTVSGKLNINCNSIAKLVTTSTSGDVCVTTNDATEMKIDTVSGNADIYIPSALGFFVEYTAIGKHFTTNANVRIDDNKYYYGDEKLKIYFVAISGNITVNVQ